MRPSEAVLQQWTRRQTLAGELVATNPGQLAACLYCLLGCDTHRQAQGICASQQLPCERLVLTCVWSYRELFGGLGGA